jgi:hypothetical protein
MLTSSYLALLAVPYEEGRKTSTLQDERNALVWCKVEVKWSRELETWRSSTYRKDVPWFPEPDPEE